MLTIERLRELLTYDSDTGAFTWIKAPGRNYRYVGKPAGRRDSNGYLIVGIDGNLYMAHRLAWFWTHKAWPEKQLDHRNRITDDNRMVNLREATYVQNSHNVGLQSRNVSGVRGVCYRPSRGIWRARVRHEGRDIYLYESPDFFEAVCARKSAENRLFGEFATRFA